MSPYYSALKNYRKYKQTRGTKNTGSKKKMDICYYSKFGQVFFLSPLFSSVPLFFEAQQAHLSFSRVPSRPPSAPGPSAERRLGRPLHGPAHVDGWGEMSRVMDSKRARILSELVSKGLHKTKCIFSHIHATVFVSVGRSIAPLKFLSTNTPAQRTPAQRD